MILTYYRVFDVTTHEILADRIDNYAFASETLEMWKRDYPHSVLSLEKYTVNTDKPTHKGFGRDPDLYND
jgi:hypothetical protein